MFTEPLEHQEVTYKVKSDTRIGEVYTLIMGTHAHTHESVLGETAELQEAFYSLLTSLQNGGDAVKHLGEIEEELSDVTFTQLSLFFSQGLIPKETELGAGVFAASKFFHRKIFMRDILAPHGIEVNVDHFHNGSNWAKPAKVKMALDLHGLKLNKTACAKISQQYKEAERSLFREHVGA